MNNSRISTKKLAVVVALTRDIHRTAFLALIKFSNGMFSYILAPNGLFQGSIVKTIIRPMRFSFGLQLGYQTIIGYLKMGNFIFNVEVKVGETSKYARSGGAFCKILFIDNEKRIAWIRLPTEKRLCISYYCMVVLGRASNHRNSYKIVAKAGINRKFNVRPSVRGVAMNPVDHPHGGRTKTNSPEVTPWNKIAKLRH